MEAEFEPFLANILEADEKVRVQARSTSAVLAVTSHRVVVADPFRVALAIPFHRVRRIQFDIERTRPATLVIVPEDAGDEPQVLAIPPDQYKEAAQALVEMGPAFYPLETKGSANQPS